LCDIFIRIANDNRSNYTVLRYLGSFSLQKSIQGIFSTNVNEDSLSIIYGLRFLSMAWVILGHAYLFESGNILINAVDIYVVSESMIFVLKIISSM
jgi:hypothetical protein